MPLFDKIHWRLQHLKRDITYNDLVNQLGEPAESFPEVTLRELNRNITAHPCIPDKFDLPPDTPFRRYIYMTGDQAHHIFFTFDGKEWRLARAYFDWADGGCSDVSS